MGPTASGKTDLAIALRQHLPVEIISVDSALVYKGLDIGSAKPTPEEQAAAPHRLIDIRDPAEPYSAADFVADAEREIQAIHAEGKIPLLVGGTMLYFKALLDGLAQMPESDPVIRAAIEQEANEKGWSHIHALLAEIDPAVAAEIHPNHSQRVSRALEVYRISGKTMTELRAQQQAQSGASFCDRYDVIQLAIVPRDRSVLHERIKQRFIKMLDNGFLGEVKALYERGDLHADLPAIRAVGYRQVWDYFDGLLNYDEMVERGVIATRQLAKRQLTWLNNWQIYPNSPLNWVYTDSNDGISLSKQEIVSFALKTIGCKHI